MRLLDKIEEEKRNANLLASCTNGERNACNLYFQHALQKIINDDLMKNNPAELFDEYREYFCTRSLPTKIIDADTVYYRGRTGNEIIHGSYDDCSYNFLLPYYKQEIEAPPSLFATGGRFNRSGTSYLYLSDTIETCLAEVHLPIGQNCSVGEFRCVEQIELIDLTQFKNDPEMENWLKILMQPVYTETKYIYNITRFLADIFKSINGNGMYFESVQAEGHNIVCFNPFLFKLVEYSEKIFTATKIKYDYQQVEDAIREYSRNGEYKYINSYNENENKRNEEKIDYLYDWIENEKSK